MEPLCLLPSLTRRVLVVFRTYICSRHIMPRNRLSEGRTFLDSNQHKCSASMEGLTPCLSTPQQMSSTCGTMLQMQLIFILKGPLSGWPLTPTSNDKKAYKHIISYRPLTLLNDTHTHIHIHLFTFFLKPPCKSRSHALF